MTGLVRDNFVRTSTAIKNIENKIQDFVQKRSKKVKALLYEANLFALCVQASKFIGTFTGNRKCIESDLLHFTPQELNLKALRTIFRLCNSYLVNNSIIGLTIFYPSML